MRQEVYRGLSLAVIAAACLFVHDAMAAPPQTDSARRHFLQLARSELATSHTCVEANEYLRELPLKQRLSVARAIVNDRDARIAYLGANILIAHGYVRDAVPALAGILASGRDQTQLNGRFGYDWQHADDTRFLRLIIMINRYLLANLSKYTGEERRRVEDLLMGGLFGGKPLEAFSKARAKKLISEWESELKGRR